MVPSLPTHSWGNPIPWGTGHIPVPNPQNPVTKTQGKGCAKAKVLLVLSESRRGQGRCCCHIPHAARPSHPHGADPGEGEPCSCFTTN